jgi:large repetitive protein
VTGDSRNVSEPTFPTTICQVVQANLQAANGVFQGYDETATGASQPDTSRVQAAIDACQSTTGISAVEFLASGANNAFLIGPITLRSGVVLLVDPGVTIYGSRNPLDYGSALCGTNTNGTGNCNNLITATGISNAGIMGYGVIDGRGQMQMIGSSQTWYDLGKHGNTQSTPKILKLTSFTNFTLYKITLRNSGYFHVYAQTPNNNGLTAWGIKISSPWDSPNTDGFDPSGSNVTLTNSFISNGDDHVAIKSDGQAATNYTISHNHFYAGRGMGIGSGTVNGDNNILVTDLVMAGNAIDTKAYGLHIKSDSSKGGVVQNVLFDGVCIKDSDHPLLFDTYYTSSTGTSYPYFKSVTIRNMHVVDDPNYSYLSSTNNVEFNGYSAAYPIGVTLDNVTFDPLILAATTDNGKDMNRFYGQYVNFTFGPGPVNIADQLPYMSPGYSAGNITAATVKPGNSNPPYDCTGKFTYLAPELFSSPNTSGPVGLNYGDSLPLNIILEPIVSDDPLPAGTVSILDNGNPIAGATATLSKTNWLTPITITGLSAGQHTLTAHFSGDSVTAKYTPMDFGSLVVNVSAIATTTTLVVTPNPAVYGQTITLTATVTASSSAPTGSVNFYDGQNLLGTQPLSNATATYTTGALSIATHSITASYGGDTNFLAATSQPTSLIVAPTPSFSITANPSTVNVAIGGSGSTVLTLTGENGFNNSVALSCGTLPNYITCSFSQNPVTVSSTSTSKLTVSVDSTTAALRERVDHSLLFGPFGIPAIFAFVPLMVLPARKAVARTGLLGLLVLLFVIGLVGCGGGGTKSMASPGRPPVGSQKLSLTANGGSNSLSLSVTVNITN